MRVFQIVLEILWFLMGLFCLFLAFRNLGYEGHSSLMFFCLAFVAFGMGAYRFVSRRKQERDAGRPRRFGR